jgi:hypothetical protein
LSIKATRHVVQSVPDRWKTALLEPPLPDVASSGGLVFLLFAACDKWTYKHHGCEPGHWNCHDNFREALFAISRDAAVVPSPVPLDEHPGEQ